MQVQRRHRRAVLAALCTLIVGGCTIAKPRSDDPWQSFNRKMFAFNEAADKAVIRPIAAGYRKITSNDVRRIVANFYTNINMPITIINDVLQVNPRATVHNLGRFVINSTIGFVGLFDPASEMNLPPDATDFGVTLAKWGVPEGPYLVLPLIGSTTARDFWRLPVDNYFGPLGWYARQHDLHWKALFLPNLPYLINLRAQGIAAENLLEGVYDPYIFFRDAYRQRRLYMLYDGPPPAEVIEELQGTGNLDVDKLLEEQHAYEKKHEKPTVKPAPPKDGGH